MKLSIIIPVYNEERTIAGLLEKVINARLPEHVSKEIVIVNDGSTDDTIMIINQYLHTGMIQLFHQKNEGKTGAVLKGIKESSGDIVMIQDADLEYDPEQYAELIHPIVSGKHLVVYGSRFMGSIKNMRFPMRLANLMTNWTLNWIFGCRMTDNNTCYKVFKKDVLSDIIITSTLFGFDCEVTVKLLQKGVHIHEIPIRYVARSKEEGKKINFVTSFGSYLQIFRYAFLEKNPYEKKQLN